MNITNEAIDAVIDLINGIGGLFATAYRGALGTGNGICCEAGPTTPQTTFLDRNEYIPINLTINGKHDNLQTLSEALTSIHFDLPFLSRYPATERWKITEITTASFPRVIAREESGHRIMASSLTIYVETTIS